MCSLSAAVRQVVPHEAKIVRARRKSFLRNNFGACTDLAQKDPVGSSDIPPMTHSPERKHLNPVVRVESMVSGTYAGAYIHVYPWTGAIPLQVSLKNKKI